MPRSLQPARQRDAGGDPSPLNRSLLPDFPVQRTMESVCGPVLGSSRRSNRKEGVSGRRRPAFLSQNAFGCVRGSEWKKPTRKVFAACPHREPSGSRSRAGRLLASRSISFWIPTTPANISPTLQKRVAHLEPACAPDQNAPVRAARRYLGIQSLIDWLRPHCGPTSEAQFLIHCDAGLGRSTATAYVAWSLYFGPGREQEAFEAMKESCLNTRIVPNTIIVAHADTILCRKGALRKPVSDWNKRVSWRRTLR